MTDLAKIRNELPDGDLYSIIDSYIAEAYKQPKDLRMTYFMGLIAKNPEANSYIAAKYPENVKEFSKLQRQAATENYNPRMVAANLGFDSVDDMFGKYGWKNLAESQLNVLINNAGLDKAKVMQFLQKGQAQKDREDKYNSGLWKLQGMVSPRQHEALLEGREPSWKDFGLDLAENALYMVPTNRVFGAGAKALGLAPKMGKASNFVLYDVGANSFVPFVMEGADAAAYDYNDNPSRADFNLKDATTGAVVNAATPAVLAGSIAMGARKLGKEGLGSRQILNELTDDPYVQNIKETGYRAQNPAFGNEAASAQAVIDQEVVDKVLAGQKKLNAEAKAAGFKNYGEMQKAEWEQWLDKPENAGLATQRERIIQNLSNPELNPTVRDINLNQYKNLNPSEVYPTDWLGEDMWKYGLDESGNIAQVIPNSKGMKLPSKEHNIRGITNEDKSFGNLKNEEQLKHTDEVYHRKTKGDEAIEAAMKRYPAGTVTFGKYALPQVAKSYATNKAGKTENAKFLMPYPEAFETGLDPEIRKNLEDPYLKRMWESGFAPNESSKGTALYEAYQIWKQFNKQEKSNEKSR